MKKNLTISLLFLIIAAIGCSAVKDIGRSAENTSENSERQSEKNAAAPETADTREFAPTSDPTADIEKLGERFLARDTFRAVMETTGETSAKMYLEYQKPDRFRIKTGLAEGKTVEMILIGNKTYINVNGRWMSSPVPMKGATMTDMINMFGREKMKWFSDIKYSGNDTIDGEPAYVYSYTGKVDGMNDSDSKIWVAKDNGLPLKAEAEYKDGKFRSTKIVYDYDTPVSIEAPIK